MYNNPSHISDDPSSLVNDSIIDQRSKLLLHSNEHQTSLEMNESIHLHSSNDLSMLHGPMENLKVEISLDNFHPDSQSIQQQLETMMKTKDMNLLEQLGHVHGLSQVYLQTSLQHGLACHEVHERRERFGANTHPKKASVPLWKLFLQALKEPMLIVLMVLAVISIVLGVVFPAPGVEDEKLKEEERRLGWIEGAAILMAVFIVSSVSALNDWQKERQFRALSTAEDDQIQIKTFRSFETVPENSITSTTFQHTAHATNNNHNASSSSNNTGENFILLPAKELVVGDVIEIDQGDCIPADGLFIEGHDLKIDESSMTGETRLIPKSSEKAPFLFSGTAVGEGYGKMLVVCVGVKSVWGKTLNAMINKSDEDKKTPLEEKLDRMASWIGKFGVGFAIATFLILLLGWLIRKVIETNSGKDQWTSNDLSSIVSFMIIAVTIVVVAVPEGLPLAVTISLAYSVKKMMKDNNLVRQLAACETMGGATDICTDKTGTLTLNEMRVVKAMIAGVEFKSETLQRDEESHEQNLPLISNIPTTVCQHVLHLVSHGISVNSKACLTKPKNGTIGKDYEVSGNRTEAALLLMLREMGIDYQPLRKLYEDEVGQIVKVNTFTGARKRMSMIVKIPPSSMEQQGHDDYYSSTYPCDLRLYLKGASEIVLNLCSRFVSSPQGTISEMTEQDRKRWLDAIEEMASQGLRTLVLAYNDMNSREQHVNLENSTETENGVTLLGLVGIKDPLRPEVIQAVSQCKKSGIVIRMVTGDNLLTAQFIARECGILLEDGICMTGQEFCELNDHDLDQILPQLQVLARSTPDDKLRLVKRLRENGRVVAMTGDGTNDGLALKEADVGLSMGLSGTMIAKEASDIVILDDNFSSIVKSVLWGRSIYENIRKFLMFQLTVNVCALLVTIVTAVAGMIMKSTNSNNSETHTDPSSNTSFRLEPPLTAIQLLWVNLIMDTFAALALATEPPYRELLDRKPYGRHDAIITKNMWFHICGQSLYQFIVLVLLYVFGTSLCLQAGTTNDDDPSKTCLSATYEVNNTLVFNTFVFCQLFNEWNCRKIHNEWNLIKQIHRSWMFVLIFVFTAVVQAIIVQVGGKAMKTVPLNGYQWLVSLVLGMMCIPLSFMMRLIARGIENLMLLRSKKKAVE